MPHIEIGAMKFPNRLSPSVTNKFFGEYQHFYPRERDGKVINLSPNTEIHNKIRDELLFRATDSWDVTKGRHSDWEEIDRNLTAYVNPDTIKAAKADSSKDIPIVIPISYASMETLLTYMSAVFMENPIIGYRALSEGAENTVKAALMQAKVSADIIRNRVALSMRTQWRDCFAYGIGVSTPGWRVERGFQYKEQQTSLPNMFGLSRIGDEKEYIQEPAILFEGNTLENIDPRFYFPDPSVPADSPQEGEYVGWLHRTNLIHLLTLEVETQQVFNIKYLKFIREGATSQFMNEGGFERSGRSVLPVQPTTVVRNNVDIMTFYVDLIPDEWGLGDEENPELWKFMLAGDEIIVGAERSQLSHGKKPVTVVATETDGYSVTPVARLEIIKGLQDQVDWLMSSRVANVRKSINDMFVVDPMHVDLNDVENQGPGKIIKLLTSAWGKGNIDQYIKQLNVQDVTSGHLNEAIMLSQFIKDLSATTDQLQGNARQGGERVTATEIQGLRQGGLSKLETIAQIIDLQMMQPLGYMFASNVQDFSEIDTFVSVFGETERRLLEEYGLDPNSARVKPRDMMLHFDVVPNTGAMPGAENAQAWLQLMPLITSDPTGQNYGFDIARVITHIMKQSGAKNVQDFKFNLIERDKLRKELQAGNLINAQEAANANSSGSGAVQPSGVGGVPQLNSGAGAPINPASTGGGQQAAGVVS